MNWNIGYISSKRAAITPEKTAFIFEDKRYTYKALDQGVNRFVDYMHKIGIKKGDRIAVVMLNCPEFLEIYLACAKLGVIFVPLNWRMVGPELEYQINDSGSRLLAFHDSFTMNIDSIRSRVKVEKGRYVYLKSGNSDTPLCPEWAIDYNDAIKEGSTDELHGPSIVSLDDPLSIVYTSGTTGNPKGAVLSHGQTYFKTFQIRSYIDITSEDIILAQLPLFHSGGLFIVATPALCNGIPMIMRRGFDANQFAEDIQKYRATIVFALTTMWNFILKTGKLDEVDVSSVKYSLGGGERTPTSLFRELSKRGIHLQVGFGQTENSAMTTVPREFVQSKIGSVGLPGFFTNIWIADEDGKEVPMGQVGRMLAQGPCVMSGYWNLPDKTNEVLNNGVLDTGDLGYKDEDGFLYLVDRAKDMYRSGGENVYPAEIEKVLYAHSKIADVAIIGVPDKKWAEVGKAFVVLKEGETLTLEEIHMFLEGKVAKYKYPRHLEILKEFPMTSTFKIKKAALKDKEREK
ncbi:MAG: AMP-binding protein [Spirochaetota bacterium]|nr:AMP-binding protein [Spirochaetota bacterium]